MVTRNTLKTPSSPEPEQKATEPLKSSLDGMHHSFNDFQNTDISCGSTGCVEKNCRALQKEGIYSHSLITCRSGSCARYYCRIVNQKNN